MTEKRASPNEGTGIHLVDIEVGIDPVELVVLAVADDHTRTRGRDVAGFEPEAFPPWLGRSLGRRPPGCPPRGPIRGHPRRRRLSGTRSTRTDPRSPSKPGRSGSGCSAGSAERGQLPAPVPPAPTRGIRSGRRRPRGPRPLPRRGPSVVLDGAGTRSHRSAASDGSRGRAISTPFTDRTAHSRTSSGTPFSRRSPRSWKSIPAPGTRSLRTEETTISPGPPIAPTLAPVWTATPPTFPPISSASPTCRPARTSRPISRTPSTISTAHRMASAWRSKTAKNPSPAVSSSFPPWRRSTCRTIRLCASSSTFHRRSPTATAMSLEPTMSVNRMVTSFERPRRDMSGVSSSRGGRARRPLLPAPRNCSTIG